MTTPNFKGIEKGGFFELHKTERSPRKRRLDDLDELDILLSLVQSRYPWDV